MIEISSRPQAVTRYRRAKLGDEFSVQRVFQLDRQNRNDDHLFNDAIEIAQSMASPESIWVVRLEDERIESFAWILIDREQRLCKINRAYANPALPEGREMAIEGLVKEVLRDLEANEPTVELLYTTMRPLAYRFDLIRSLGFKTLGLFPNGKETDKSQINSLAAYFFGNTLNSERRSRASLHPKIAELFEIVRVECGLESLAIADEADIPTQTPVPEHALELEIITAPLFVSRRFQALKRRRSLAIHFYPFNEPNTLITNPEQTVEIFVRILPDGESAMVIGERFDIGVDPISLYSRTATMLRNRGVSYIEVINDASDIQGTESILQAGYIPCAYFPSLKGQGDVRRDYIVFARSFENISYPRLDSLNPIYIDYLRQYHRMQTEEAYRKFESYEFFEKKTDFLE